jgi:8-oxo-dGTP pyrophosphatase MutT (NUDIX family)
MMTTDVDRLHALGKIRPTHPTIRPKDSATLIILDRSGNVPKVLLGKRHEGHIFMPGMFVFPGGRVETADAGVPAVNELDPAVTAKLVQGASLRQVRALALSALRETFEETGLMLGLRRSWPQAKAEGVWSAFAENHICPNLAPLRFVARAVTPPGLARRFDTRFFAVDAEAIVHRAEGIVGPRAELVELAWVPVAAARDLPVHAITAAILDELEARLAAGMGHDLPVPYYRMKYRRFVRELL